MGHELDQLRLVLGVIDIAGDGGVCVTGVQSDSRRVQRGDLFAAIPGERADGAAYAADAVTRGASAVLASRVLPLSVPTVVCDDVRARLGAVAHAVYGDPTRDLRTVGITGTNGKTTVTHLLESVLVHAGARPALLGTVTQRGPAFESEAELTTPEADAVARFARQQAAAGATHLLMEVSSHALDLGRARGVDFEVAEFTNLTQDHLDHHGTMQAYGSAKARLFVDFAPRHSIIMVDTAYGLELAARARGEVVRCSLGAVPDAALCVREWRSTRAGIWARIATPEGELTLESPLYGAHNVENLLVTLGCARALGVDPALTARALRNATGAPGRMERVADGRGVVVLVDYAHTPDALTRALEAARPLTAGRLFVVCGCGGDRDRSKRAKMGQAAAQFADVAVLSSDNPRSEDPDAILAEMAAGALGSGALRVELESLPSDARGVAVLVDRRQAIGRVLALARAGDTVLIAGKGHETYQIVGGTRLPFDDREEARRAIAALGGT